MILIVGVVLLAIFFVTMLMLRGCFCDCFGPMYWGCGRKDEEEDRPLDQEVLQKMLNECKKSDVRRELMAHEQEYGPVSTISDGMAQPYNTTVIVPSAPAEYRRPASPPPAYSSVAGSAERLNSQMPHTQI
ncbi:unnamed protein product, partial [Mesorhabditis spiculigera]